MHCDTANASSDVCLPYWVIENGADHVQRPSIRSNVRGFGSVAPPASTDDITQDAGRFALSYCRDFRALHQFNHDHDCTATCIKYVAKQCKDAAQEALRKGKVVACRFFFFHIKVFTYAGEMLHGFSETVTKRIRRRGKKLVTVPYIAVTNERNEFCKPVLQRDTPFRSSSTDVGQVWARCNADFQFMPRTIDPMHFMEDSAERPAVLEVKPADAVAMYGVRMKMPDAPMLRRTFHTIVAMYQACHNCDYYITKYHAKPMAQLQSLLTDVAVGLRRLEAEEEANQVGADQPANAAEDRARRTTLKIANAANRSSWCSCCEMACFVKTGALVRRTHRPNAIFLSRSKYLYEQCRRLLQSTPDRLIEAQMPVDEHDRHVDVLCFSTSNTHEAVHHADQSVHELDAHSAAPPVGLHSDEQNENDDSDKYSSEEEHIFNDSDDSEYVDEDHVHTDDAAAPADPLPADDAVQLDEQTDSAARPEEDAETLEDNLDISALEATTSAHDDWLHRGPFLFDMDFHTYMRFTDRKPRPKDHKISDVNNEAFSAEVFHPWVRWDRLGSLFGNCFDGHCTVACSIGNSS